MMIIMNDDHHFLRRLLVPVVLLCFAVRFGCFDGFVTLSSGRLRVPNGSIGFRDGFHNACFQPCLRTTSQPVRTRYHCCDHALPANRFLGVNRRSDGSFCGDPSSFRCCAISQTRTLIIEPLPSIESPTNHAHPATYMQDIRSIFGPALVGWTPFDAPPSSAPAPRGPRAPPRSGLARRPSWACASDPAVRRA